VKAFKLPAGLDATGLDQHRAANNYASVDGFEGVVEIPTHPGGSGYSPGFCLHAAISLRRDSTCDGSGGGLIVVRLPLEGSETFIRIETTLYFGSIKVSQGRVKRPSRAGASDRVNLIQQIRP
jgi:hypothetical protein